MAESFVSNEWLFKPLVCSAKWVRERIAAGDIFFGARREYRLVGAIEIAFSGSGADFTRLCVVPEARRRGIATRLIAYAEEEAISRGAATVTSTTADELGIGSMFVNAGFSVTEREMVYAAEYAKRPFCRIRYSKRTVKSV
jgi:GNAT superfamily N-acetyltransferase